MGETMILPYNPDMGAYWYAGDPAKVQVMVNGFNGENSGDRNTKGDHIASDSKRAAAVLAVQSTFKPDSAPITMENQLENRLKSYEMEAKKKKEVETNFKREKEFLRFVFSIFLLFNFDF